MASVKSLVDMGISRIPDSFLRQNDRPIAPPIYSEDIPVIDLQGLNGPKRADVLNAISKACHEWGLFQVINHGVPEKVMDSMVETHHRFFELPEEKKTIYTSEGIGKGVSYVTNLHAEAEAALNWRDYLGIIIPDVIDAQALEIWPPVLRDAVVEYSTHTKSLAANLFSAFSEILGVSCFPDNLMKLRRIVLNYYPPCPNPEMTFGLAAHSDPGLLALLLQDDVAGLQVLHDGRWIAVHPSHNGIVIIVGDALEVLSNGRFQSVEHRAVPCRDRTRISTLIFNIPDLGSTIGPLPELIDETHPAKYTSFDYGDYLNSFMKKARRRKGDGLAAVRIT